MGSRSSIIWTALLLLVAVVLFIIFRAIRDLPVQTAAEGDVAPRKEPPIRAEETLLSNAA
jgi:hypothetical protein